MLIVGYFIIVNIIGYGLYYVDKKRAIANQYRISEKMLLTFSGLGGSVGSLVGMYHLHHKNRKKKFIVLNWLFLFLQIAFLQYLGG